MSNPQPLQPEGVMHGLVPRDRWEHDLNDLCQGLYAAAGPREQNSVLQLAELGACVPVRSGRAGLVAAIRALNLPNNARIGVPLYCCPIVFQAIVLAGCCVRFIDIDPETFCLSAGDLSTKIADLDAVVAVHLFGNLCDIPGLRNAAPGKPVIEDCAQALGSRLHGRMAGSFGDVAFFSFRSGKYLSAGEGGALFSSDAILFSRLSAIAADLQVPGPADEWAHALMVYLKSLLRSRPLYGIVGHGLWKFLNSNRQVSDRAAVILSQIYATDLSVIRRRLSYLDAAIREQRAIAEYYDRTLDLAAGMLYTEKPEACSNRYHYPVTFATEEHRDRMAEHLLRQRIDTMKYLDDVVSVARTQYGYAGDCPIAEQRSKRVLVIPSYYGLKHTDIQHIARAVNAGWAEIAANRTGTHA